MNKLGIVTQVNNNEAIVMVAKSAACGTSCGCGAMTRVKGQMKNDDHHYIKVKNSIDAKIGDPVKIEFETSKLLSTSVLIYLVPLVMLVIGIVIANYLQGENPNDLLSFISGIISLFVSYLILSIFDKKDNKKELITISEFKGY